MIVVIQAFALAAVLTTAGVILLMQVRSRRRITSAFRKFREVHLHKRKYSDREIDEFISKMDNVLHELDHVIEDGETPQTTNPGTINVAGTQHQPNPQPPKETTPS